MAKRSVHAGNTSNREYIVIRDGNGSPITGLAFNSTGLIAYYVLPGAASVAITLATQTVTGAWSSGGFVEVDATHMPGLYRFDIPDAVFAAGNHKAIVCLSGYAGMSALYLEYDLWAIDPQDSVRAGLSALPNGSMVIKKNAALANFPFVMRSSTTFLPLPGLTVTATRRIDGGAFAACANAVTEIANGWYTIDFAAGDLNGSTIGFRASSSGAIDTDVTFVTQP